MEASPTFEYPAYHWKDKIRAFIAHLFLSCVVALLSVIVVFYIWYPTPLDTAVGVTEIFLIVLAVDISIGPLITFIVYKKGKKTLKFDLIVVALLQISALCYGMYTVFTGRPAFVVYNVDRFDVSRAHEIDEKSMQTAVKNHNKSAEMSWLEPKWVGAIASKDHKRRNEITFSAVLDGGPDWPQLPELFVPMGEVNKQIIERSKPLAELRKLHEKEAAVIKKLANWQDSEVKWLPLRGSAQDCVVLVNAKTGAIITSLPIKPWI